MKIILILIFLISLVFFSTTVNAQVSLSCPSCYINNCQCSITNCTNGTVKIYIVSDCSGVNKYQYSFSNSSLAWNSSQTGNYYFKVLCSDENISACTNVVVSGTPTSITTTTSGGGNGGGGGGGGGTTTTRTTTIAQTTTTTARITTVITPIRDKCNWVPPSQDVLGQCEAVVGYFYDTTLKRCVGLSGCKRPVDIPFSTLEECKKECEIIITSCEQECNNKGYVNGVCRSWAVVLKAKVGCEANEENIGETSDCFVPPDFAGVGRTCCCSAKTTIDKTRYYFFVVIGIIFTVIVIYSIRKRQQEKREEKFEGLKEKWKDES
jgi:hypothetical protein